MQSVSETCKVLGWGALIVLAVLYGGRRRSLADALALGWIPFVVLLLGGAGSAGGGAHPGVLGDAATRDGLRSGDA